MSYIRKRELANGGHSWQVVIELGVDPEDGQRKRIFETITGGTKKDAEKKMREMLAELDQQTFIKGSNVTVEKYLHEWLDTYIIPHKSKTTTKGYIANIENYIIPEFGKTKLQDLTPLAIQKFYNKLKKKSPLSSKPLSSKSIKNIHVNFSAALKRAVQLDLIKKNPAENMELEKCQRYQAEVYNSEELQRLVEVVKGTDLEVAIMILICLGLRRGELLALKWEHVDFKKSTVNIIENVVQIKNETFTKAPKTESGKRKIEIPETLLNLLKKARTDYAKRKLQYGTKFKDTGLIVCQPDGRPYLPDSISQKFAKFLKKHKLKYIRLHDLRHTNATLMLKLGISPKVAQKRLGHSHYSTTMDTYSHVLEEVEKEAVEKLEAGLQKILM